MNKKYLWIIVVILIIGIIGVYMFLIKKEKANVVSEYEPEEEISEQQERQTLVSLYFINKNTRKVEPEARLIDVKQLVNEPYEILMELISGEARNDNLESAIPKDTKLNSAKMNVDTLILDFSSEFVENHVGGKEEEEKTIEVIVNTFTELTEVNSIKILIDGEENKGFKDECVKFDNEFIRSE